MQIVDKFELWVSYLVVLPNEIRRFSRFGTFGTQNVQNRFRTFRTGSERFPNVALNRLKTFVALTLPI